jgi:urease accessory protein
LLHPVAGLDHLLVMIGVGLFAATLGGRARWLLPATFVSAMALAAVAAMSGLIGGSPAEHLIAFSVMAIGLPVALALKPTLPSAMALVALCAAVHGHAHGVELPQASGATAFLVGFVLSTALLHATGAIAGMALNRVSVAGYSLTRGAGAAMTLAGVVLVLG